MRPIETPLGRLYLRESRKPRDDKPVALLVHGSGGEAASWAPVLDRFEQVHPIAIDMPGHGESTGRFCDGAEEAAEAVDAVRAALGLDSVVVIGQSLGGAVAQTYARRHAAYCSAAVVASSGCTFNIDPARLALIDSDWPACIEHYARGQISERASVELLDEARRQVAKRNPAAMKADLMACTRFDSRPWVGEIAPPVLIVSAYEDRLTPFATVLPLLDGAPRAEMTLLSPGGHALMLEHPARFAAAIDSFLEQIGQS